MAMRELVRTNNAVLVSDVAALLDGAAIPCLVFDQNVSTVEGSIGIFPRRIVVAEMDAAAARRLLEAAGFARDLRSDADADR
jgi:hypothetical protein